MDLFQKQLDKKKRKNIDSNNKEKMQNIDNIYNGGRILYIKW